MRNRERKFIVMINFGCTNTELAPNMWWLRMGLDNTKMADNVSFIVKVLCGSFYVNSERFSG